MLPRPFAAALACAAAATSASAASPQLGLTVSADGSYSVTLDGTAWLASGATAVAYNNLMHSTASGSLKADGAPTPVTGSNYTGYTQSFNGGLFVVEWQLYAQANAIVFVQAFPKGLTGMAVNGGSSRDLASSFPTFAFTPSTSIGWLTWPEWRVHQRPRQALATTRQFVSHRSFHSHPHPTHTHTPRSMCQGVTGIWTAASLKSSGLSDDGGSPLVLYNKTAATVVLSTLRGYMTGNVGLYPSVGGNLGSGFNGMIQEVPAGWGHETVLIAGQGINDTVMAWGDLLLARTGKHRHVPRI